ncbi:MULTISPECIES: MOSC domain-containing protein [unclassified Sphingomonas]|uniref:MOSC domain-containing protein n=1 Tax=unclassified Sphingomonas TaxID=196159 RepID=UPI000701738A|nr:MULTISPECIES: MOSC domain-containing protein [unclassified Sphingomonas]KQX21644.1 molybdenum cofactor biosysynthesis protein [Sphingomonas sp. Root1294]KQY72960.1 molybdenum cofactor biosysynthesis protein [Sphingomonas sp. Root50]KRB88246.1 molybdenum cofactor biosysynthesis protein [Sphingomonas sp. Root720]
MAGRLIGIARKNRPHAPMDVLDHVEIGLDTGVYGDHRGAIRPGKSNRRQVTILTAEDWMAAIADLGRPVSWEQRRANLLVEGVILPREEGARLRIGGATLEITGECDPCRRMDAVADGLQSALRPDWRGGRNARVIEGGAIALGDRVEVEG